MRLKYSYDVFIVSTSKGYKECLCFFVIILIISCVERQEDKFCWIEQNFCRKEVETPVVEMFDNVLKANSSLKINKL